MIKKDYHVHTVYSDGKDSLEDVVLSAIDKGMSEIGFSDHSYTFFDQSYCVKREKTEEYIAEISRLKEKYAGKIKILCGIEQDFYSTEPTDKFDYAIGSVHYLKKDGVFIPVDESKEILAAGVKECFGGDYLSACEEYYKTVGEFSEREDIKIIGHFDLIAKFNGDGSLFDEQNGRYISAWQNAAEKLVKSGKVFEINTGALRKGLRSDAYPAKSIRDYIKSIGGKFVLSSDSHKKEDLLFSFELFENEV